LLQHERDAWKAGHRRVAGVDEAGRGPLAGPVVAAAVLFDAAFLEAESSGILAGLTDSKKLSAARREHFFSILSGTPHARIGVGRADVAEIDDINILRATHRAMARALDQIQPLPDLALVDGLPVKGLPCPHTAIVGGDGLSLSIAAASVIAKVTRDRLMVELDRLHPGYGFAAHKGYGTRAHLDALRRLGPSPCHRRSFGPVRQMQLGF
jgi:ribonuclease HII